MFQALRPSVSCCWAEYFSAVTQPFIGVELLDEKTEFGGQTRLMETFWVDGDLNWSLPDDFTMSLTRIRPLDVWKTVREIRCKLCWRFTTTSAVDFRRILDFELSRLILASGGLLRSVWFDRYLHGMFTQLLNPFWIGYDGYSRSWTRFSLDVEIHTCSATYSQINLIMYLSNNLHVR